MLNSIIKSSIENTISESENIWVGTYLEDMIPLTSDERGRCGEEVVFEIIKYYTDFPVEWYRDKNINLGDGKYDTKINNFRVEVKTAMRGNNNKSWQHDVIRSEEVWDKLIFVDFDLDGVWFTIINHNQMVFKRGIRNEIFKKSATPCKGGWKFDMSMATFERGIKNGITFFYPIKTEVREIENNFSIFLRRNFGKI